LVTIYLSIQGHFSEASNLNFKAIDFGRVIYILRDASFFWPSVGGKLQLNLLIQRSPTDAECGYNNSVCRQGLHMKVAGCRPMCLVFPRQRTDGNDGEKTGKYVALHGRVIGGLEMTSKEVFVA
jgi:hypothetical protein